MDDGGSCAPSRQERLTNRHRELWLFVRDAVRESQENRVLRMAAALAYYAMFALAPLLILMAAVARLALGRTAEAEISGQLAVFVGEAGAGAIATLLDSLDPASTDLVTTIIGGIGLLIGASALFDHLRDSLNTIWEVAPHPDRGLWRFTLERLAALAMVGCVGVIALVGLTLSIELAGWAETLMGDVPLVPPWLAARSAQVGVSFLVVMLLVALTYRLLPNCRIAWRDVWVGAGATALLVVLSQALIGLYLRSSRVSSAYSVIGAVVIVLIWIYYSAVVFFFGAELTWLYSNRYGARIEPGEGALSLAAGDRAAQGLLRSHEIAAAAEGQRAADRAVGEE